MDTHEKKAWRLGIIYVLISLLFTASQLLFGARILDIGLSLLFQICLLAVFYMAFKKKKLLFSALCLAWLLYGSYQAVQRAQHFMATSYGTNGYAEVLIGISISLVFMLFMTYLTLRVFLKQLKL